MRTEYDYIITGSGAAGSVIAARLTEDKDVSVLVVEAGGADSSYLFHWPAGFARMTKGMASWGWSTVPQEHMQNRVLWYTQGKVRGGASSINAMVYTRGNPRDFDAWQVAGWSYADVLPYFKRSEHNERFADTYHGQDGPIAVSAPRGTLPICDAFIRAGQEFGLPYNPDFNGISQEGVGFYQVSIRNGRRSSVAVEYLTPASTRPNLEVVLNAEVARIVVDNGTATGVDVNTGGKITRVTASREVIVASGAIGSPRLLQLSGIGDPAHLEKLGIDIVAKSPHVGDNLQDHLDVCVLCECTGNHSYDSIQRPDKIALAGLQYLLFGTGPVTSSLFETGGFGFADKEARSPDIQFHFGQGSGIEAGIVTLDNPGVTLNSANMRPRSRGTVRIASSNPRTAPLIDPQFLSNEKDLEVTLRGLEMAREIMMQNSLKPYIAREVLPGASVAANKQELFDYVCKMGKTDHHPVGTCKMGTSDDCVVDPQLRLRGVENLRVCDSSIMPLEISSNTHAASIMVGEKAADLIAGKEPLPAEKLPPEHPCSAA